MNDIDPVLARLSELAPLEPDPSLSEKLRVRAHQALRPRPVHPLFALAAAASVVLYLGWALYFTSGLY